MRRRYDSATADHLGKGGKVSAAAFDGAGAAAERADTDIDGEALW